jgi:rhodanese-related sulfurtransferase
MVGLVSFNGERFMARSFAEMIILVAIGIVMGFTINTFNPDGIPLIGQWNPERGLVHAGGTCVEEEGMVDNWDITDYLNRSDVLFVDARTRAEFAEGHIPGSFNLPVGEVDNLVFDFMDLHPQDMELVIYCSGPECHDAPDLAKILTEYGYQNIKVYWNGMSGWKQANRHIDIL